MAADGYIDKMQQMHSQSNKDLHTYLHTHVKSVTYLWFSGYFSGEPRLAGRLSLGFCFTCSCFNHASGYASQHI